MIRASFEKGEPFFVAVFILSVVLPLPVLLIFLAYRVGPIISFVTFGAAIGSAILLLAMGLRRREIEIIKMRPVCGTCGALMESEETRFCAKCGARVIGAAGETRFDLEPGKVKPGKRIGTCMVCNLSLEATDILAWCPHCGSPAHKTHLLEWVHVKSKCPICGQHIDEREINLRTLKKP